MPGSETNRPLIFISHSAKDAAARSLLAGLCWELRKQYEVLLDRERLRPGDHWRKELHTWMGLCHGAVVLLSEDALLRSPWVKKEAAVLGYRAELDENFVLVPVLVPPVEACRLGHGDFEPLALGAIQAAAGDTPAAVVRQVLDRLEPLRERAARTTRLQEVEYMVATILSELEDGRYAKPLSDAAALLGKRLGWRTDRGQAAQLARELLSADLEKVAEVLVFLAKYFREREETVIRILNLLSPFWVDPDAVSELARMTERPRRQRVVSVSGERYPFTGQCYIRRACAGTYDWVAVKLTSLKGLEEVKAEEKLKLVEKEIREQMVAQLGFDEEEPSAEDIERQLDRMEGRREPYFVLVPKGFDEDVTALLRDRLTSFTFFLLEGDRAPAAPTLRDWQIVLLKPDLAAGRDQAVYDLLGDTRGKIKRTR
jgi:hypothetical protein